jgi:DnaJ-class molecular chaperone
MEVAKSASDREVKKAYHKLAMKWHPDKNAGCEDCQVKFQRVARAYEVLSDPMKRKIYDKASAERHWERLIALYRRRLG